MTGDRNTIRVNKEKRENELREWVKGIIAVENGFKPNFTVFLIEPQSANQKVTGILTLALKSDK